MATNLEKLLNDIEIASAQQGDKRWLKGVARIRKAVSRSVAREEFPEERPKLRSSFQSPPGKLDETLASKINQAFGSEIDDEFPVGQVKGLPHLEHYLPERLVDRWKLVREEMNPTQVTQVDSALWYIPRELTTGDFRYKPSNKLVVKGRLGLKRVTFLKECFQTQENES